MRLLVAFMSALWLYGGELKVMTEDLAPYSFYQDGVIVGISTEMVKKCLEKFGYEHEQIDIYPWARALKVLENTPNAILFSTAFSNERAERFKFACPLIENRIYFFKKNGSSAVIKSVEEAKKVKKIGVVNDFLEHEELVKLGFENLDISSSYDVVLRKLIDGRIELATGDPIDLYQSRYDVDMGEVQNTGVWFKEYSLCIAFNKAFSDEEVARWEDELKKMHEGGEFEQIYKKYIK